MCGHGYVFLGAITRNLQYTRVLYIAKTASMCSDRSEASSQARMQEQEAKLSSSCARSYVACLHVRVHSWIAHRRCNPHNWSTGNNWMRQPCSSTIMSVFDLRTVNTTQVQMTRKSLASEGMSEDEAGRLMATLFERNQPARGTRTLLWIFRFGRLTHVV